MAGVMSEADRTPTKLSNPERHWALPGVLRRKDWLAIGLMASGAFLGNYFPIPLMFGVDVLVGGILVYILLFQYGLLVAFLAGLPSFLATVLIWSHPWAALALGSELLILGVLLRWFSEREPPLLVAAIWVPVGSILTFSAYHFLLELSLNDAVVVALKQAINSISNVTLAVVVNHLVISHLLRHRSRLLSVSEALFYLPAVLVVLVVALMLFLVSQQQLRQLNDEFAERLRQTESAFIDQTNQVLRRLERDMALFNASCVQSGSDFELAVPCMRSLLPLSEWDRLHYLPETDAASGLTIQGSGMLPLTQSPYLEAYQSWLAEGRDLNFRYWVSDGSHLHYFRPARIGNDIGYLVGSLDLRLASGRIWRSPSDPMQRQSWLLENEIVAASPSARFDFLDPLTDYERLARGEIGHSLPDIPGMNNVNRWARSSYYAETELIHTGLSLPGFLRTEISPQNQQAGTFSMYTVILTLALFFILLSLLISHWVTRWLLRPLKGLVRLSRKIPQQMGAHPNNWYWPESLPIREMEELQQGLKEMSAILYQQYQKNLQHNHRLEQEVAARTRDLESAQQHINSILGSMEGVLWSGHVINDELSLMLVSPSVTNLTGYGPEDWMLRGRELYPRIRERHRGKVATELRQMTRRNKGQFELEFRHADGRWCYFRVRYWAVRASGGRPLRIDGLVTDITHWHEAQEKIREQEELLVHQSRRAAMGEMVSNIAHQWRQPLNSLRLVQANLRDAQDYGELTPDLLVESLDKTDHLIDRMNQTVRDFLNFFRPAKAPEVFNLTCVIEESVRIMRATFSDYPVEVRAELEDRVQVYGFPNEILQIMLVLLQNAREAIEERAVSGGEIRIALYREQGQARVIVADNAGGIADDIIAQIFDPYFTTRAEGTGIGLYMAKRLIEGQMQGEISACNVESGAEFRISLPLAEDGQA